MPPKKAAKPRSGHIKSRTGCKKCKLRHIRCDETFPQWFEILGIIISYKQPQLICSSRNCTKRQMRCTYLDEYESRDGPAVSDDSTVDISVKSTRPYVKWPAQTRTEVQQWLKSGMIPPFGHLAPKVHLPIAVYSENELCYLYHIMKLYKELEASGLAHLTILSTFMPSFFHIASDSRLVMDGLLLLSASHIEFSTGGTFSRIKTYNFKIQAIRQLREGIELLNIDQADEVIAGSIALLCLSENLSVFPITYKLVKCLTRSRDDWKCVAQGIMAVSSICKSLGHNSNLVELLTYSTVGSLRATNDNSDVLRPLSIGITRCIIAEMERFGHILTEDKATESDRKRLAAISSLAQDISDPAAPAQSSEGFDCIRRIKDYFLWIPITGILSNPNVCTALMVNAYLYSVVLQSGRIFPLEPLMRIDGNIQDLLKETLDYLTLHSEYIQSVKNLKAILAY